MNILEKTPHKDLQGSVKNIVKISQYFFSFEELEKTPYKDLQGSLKKIEKISQYFFSFEELEKTPELLEVFHSFKLGCSLNLQRYYFLEYEFSSVWEKYLSQENKDSAFLFASKALLLNWKRLKEKRKKLEKSLNEFEARLGTEIDPVDFESTLKSFNTDFGLHSSFFKLLDFILMGLRFFCYCDTIFEVLNHIREKKQRKIDSGKGGSNKKLDGSKYQIQWARLYLDIQNLNTLPFREEVKYFYWLEKMHRNELQSENIPKDYLKKIPATKFPSIPGINRLKTHLEIALKEKKQSK